ncbi:hypothetical protein ACVU7I_16745, partial [Patulibacter sp. S7RM1-6]
MRQGVNLLPPEERPDGRAAAGGPFAPWIGVAAVGGVVLVVLLALWGVARHQASSARSQEAAATARTAPRQAELSRLAPVVRLDRLRTEREEAIVRAASGRTDWAGALRAAAGA